MIYILNGRISYYFKTDRNCIMTMWHALLYSIHCKHRKKVIKMLEIIFCSLGKCINEFLTKKTEVSQCNKKTLMTFKCLQNNQQVGNMM